jgi:Spy/CpxP family protein refolding chaperone
MNKPWKVILAFFGVFLAGAVFGGFVSLRVARSHDFRSAAMDKFTPMLLRRFADRLELTPEQLVKIRPIVTATEVELRRLRNSGFKETIAVAESMNEQIAKVLTPGQLSKLEELKMEMRERWRRERPARNIEGGRLPPPPPGDSDEPPPGP